MELNSDKEVEVNSLMIPPSLRRTGRWNQSRCYLTDEPDHVGTCELFHGPRCKFCWRSHLSRVRFFVPFFFSYFEEIRLGLALFDPRPLFTHLTKLGLSSCSILLEEDEGSGIWCQWDVYSLPRLPSRPRSPSRRNLPTLSAWSQVFSFPSYGGVRSYNLFLL